MSNVAIALSASSDSYSTSKFFEFFPSPAKQPNLQNQQDLTILALTCKCFDISDHAGAAIASAIKILKSLMKMILQKLY